MLHNVINKFNRGEIDSKALSRDDVEKINNTCALMSNFLPMRLGPMMYRPGLEYLGDTVNGILIPFVAAVDDTAIIELKDAAMRIWVNDALITSSAVTSVIDNPSFTGHAATVLDNWIDDSGAGAQAIWVTGNSAALTGSDTNFAILYQTISTTEANKEHSLKVFVSDAPVIIKLGINGVSSTDIAEETLLPGCHVLVFTPTADFTITFVNTANYTAKVDSVELLGTGVISIFADIYSISHPEDVKYAQSADVVFVVGGNAVMCRVERRGVKSWSFCEFRCDDGPFDTINTTPMTLAVNSITGDATLTSSEDFFTSTNVDAGDLYKLVSAGQTVTATVAAADNGTDPIRVTGVGDTRRFTINIDWPAPGAPDVSTVTLQQSADGVVWSDTASVWSQVSDPVSTTFTDGIDNAIYYYRLYVKIGDFTAGAVDLELIYAAGSIDGICRVVSYIDSKNVTVQVLKNFGSTAATKDWYRGSWTLNNMPTAVAFYEGRLWFAGHDKLWGSVSDAYTSFDTGLEGNSAAIQRSVAFGPTGQVNWLAPNVRLMMGIASSEIAVRSTSFGEILTPMTTNLKCSSTQGSGPQEPLIVDDLIYFVHRSRSKIYEAAYAGDRDSYIPTDITLLNQDICLNQIYRIAVSRQPETRIWVVLQDGDVRVYLVDPTENVRAWSRITTDGSSIIDVVVLPGLVEDEVYFAVNRNSAVRLEKMASTRSALGGSRSEHFDSFKSYTSPGTTITGLSHLNGDTVGVWADGQDRGTYTVSGGSITVSASWTNVTVGLPYTADYISNKVGHYVTESVLNKPKRIVDVGLVLENYYPGSLEVGPSVSLLEAMPLIENGFAVPTTTTISTYDYYPFEFNGTDETDPRIYMRATGPVTVLSLRYGIQGTPKREPSATKGA